MNEVDLHTLLEGDDDWVYGSLEEFVQARGPKRERRLGVLPPTFTMTFEVYYEMIRYGMKHTPYEACGLVAGKDGRTLGFFPIWNDDLSEDANDSGFELARVSYEMNPLDQFNALTTIHARGWAVQAVFHTHPLGSPFPSFKDKHNAVWTDVCAYIIASFQPEGVAARAWDLGGDDAQEIELVVE